MQPHEREEFAVLVLKYLDEQLADDEFAHLEQRLRTDPDARRLYCELTSVEDALPLALTQLVPNADTYAAAPAAGHLVVSATEPPTARKRIATQWRSTIAATLVGCVLCGAVFVPVVAGQNAQVQQLTGTLQEFREYIQQFVGAFHLALDTDREPGPTAIVAGYDHLVVAGAVDPQIIERVEIEWGVPNGIETIELSRHGATKDKLARLHARHRYAVQTGHIYSVVVRAVPWESQRATVESLERGESWLGRKSSFLCTPQGLVPMHTLPVALQLTGGQRIVDDELTIDGTSFATGSLALLFTTSEGRRHVLQPPMPVMLGRPFSMSRLPFEYPNGAGMVDVVFAAFSPSEWPVEFQQPSAASFPESYDFDAMPPGTRRWPIAVNADLPPIEHRVAQRVIELGGTFNILSGIQEARTPADIPAGRFQIQTISLDHTPVRDLQFLRRLKFLQGLHLADTPVDDASLTGIHKDLPKLNWIVLSGSQITDQTIVEEVAKCPQTAYLSIGELPQLSNRSIEAIADHLTELTDLTMDDSAVTSILPLSRLPKLTRLQIHRSKVPETEFNELQRLRPDMKIER